MSERCAKVIIAARELLSVLEHHADYYLECYEGELDGPMKELDASLRIPNAPKLQFGAKSKKPRKQKGSE